MSNEVDIRDSDGDVVGVLTKTITQRNGVDLDVSKEAQVVGLVLASDGNAKDVSAANPLPTDPSSAGDVATGGTDGRVTVPTPGTAVAVHATLACLWVMVQALPTNTDRIAAGFAPVAAVGSEVGQILAPGATATFPVADAAAIKVDARVAGQGATVSIGTRA
jgi:hypothetical protein